MSARSCGTLSLRQNDIRCIEDGVIASASSVNGTRSSAGWRLSGTAEPGRREGPGSRASLPDVAGLVPATRGLIAAPWTPASLSLLPAQKRVETDHGTSSSIRRGSKRDEDRRVHRLT